MKRSIVASLVCIVAGIAGVAACNGDPAAGPVAGALPPVTLLSPDTANHLAARFSPDGSRLYWWEPDGLTYRLWTADAALGSPAQVAVTSNEATPLSWSPDGSRIAVASSASGVAQVALMTAAGEIRPFVEGQFSLPVGWNADGDRLAYLTTTPSAGASGIQTFVASVSRGGATQLVPGERRPLVGTWSPDGARIAYTLIDKGRTTIWAADSSGQNARQLTTDGFEYFPRMDSWFSPDGSAVAYQSSRTGTMDIWVAPVDGGPRRQLTRDVRNDWDPIWSPDGKWIAFVSDRGKQTDLWVVPAAGGDEIRVTDDAEVEQLMQWLPDSRLAFLTGVGQNALWSMNLADGTTRQLTADSLLPGYDPILSPDGSMVTFLLRYSGNSDVVVMPTAGGPIRVLAKGSDNSDLTWSPDGTRIAFSSDRGGTGDVWVAEVAGGALRQLTSSPDRDRDVQWNADGTAVYFISDRDAKLSDVWQVPAAGGEPTRLTRHGTVNSLVTRKGKPGLYATILGADGNFKAARIDSGGAVVPVWTHGTSFLAGILPSDSIVVGEPIKGGGYSYRIIAPDGRGEGTPLLNPGEGLSDWSRDGQQIVYNFRNGATWELAILDRTTGAVRRLTDDGVNETSGVMTADGKTLVYERWRDVKRIAIADLSGVVGTKVTAGR